MSISSKNQEEISICYFNAVVAKANAIPNGCRRDEDGVDASVRMEVALDTGDSVFADANFQLKSVYSTSSYGYYPDGTIYYDLKVKNYNDLVKRAAIDRYLVLLILPEDDNEWVTQDKEQLSIKRCMYYTSLKGKEPSSNLNTVRVTFDKNDVFNPDNLIKILKKSIEGETDND